jgi:4-amino-4-deoxy-L-arabinose transferase-like glycosyltransferase
MELGGQGSLRGAAPVLAALCVAGFLLRAWNLDVVHFELDEGVVSSLATQLAYGRATTLVGVKTSFGFFNPPTLPWMLAPIFALTRDPARAALLPILLGTLAILLAWVSGRELAGTRGAWMAAVLVAVSPNAVEHCRRLWGHDFQVPCAALCYTALLLALRRDPRWLAVAAMAAATAQTLHLSGAIHWLAIAVVAAQLGRKAAKPAVVGLLWGALLYAPWLLHQWRDGWPDISAVRAVLTSGGAARDLGHPVPPFIAWAFVLGDSWHNDLLGRLRPWMVAPTAGLATGIGALALLATGVVAARSLGRQTATALLLPVLASPVLFGLLLRASVPPYHLPILFPLALLAAAGLARSRCGWLPLGLFAVASISGTITVRSFLAAGGGDGVPLREKQAAVRSIAEAAGGQPFTLREGRREVARLDFSTVYLLHWADLTALYRPGSERIFVIQRHGTEPVTDVVLWQGTHLRVREENVPAQADAPERN